jgi:hypothetical protein
MFQISNSSPVARSFRRIRPTARPCVTFHKLLDFYGEESLVTSPSPKLENHLLSAVRDCLFNTFASYPVYLEAVCSIRNLRWHAMPWGQGPPLNKIVVEGTSYISFTVYNNKTSHSIRLKCNLYKASSNDTRTITLLVKKKLYSNLEYEEFSNAFPVISPPSLIGLLIYCSCKSIVDRANQP